MFDSFNCDFLNGHNDGLDNDSAFEEDFIGEEYSRSSCVSSADVILKEHFIYGKLLAETDKAILFKLVCRKTKKFYMGPDRWLPKSEVSTANEDENDHKPFIEGMKGLHEIDLPYWLLKKFKNADEYIYTTFRINH